MYNNPFFRVRNDDPTLQVFSSSAQCYAEQGLGTQDSCGLQGQRQERTTEILAMPSGDQIASNTERPHSQRRPSGSARTVQRRLSRLSPTDSACDLATQNPEQDLFPEDRRTSGDSAQELGAQQAESQQHRARPHALSTASATIQHPSFQRYNSHRSYGLARPSISDSVQEMETLRQEHGAWADADQNGADSSAGECIPPATRQAGALSLAHAAARDSGRDLHSPPAASDQSYRPGSSNHATSNAHPDVLPVGLVPGQLQSQTTQSMQDAAAAGDLSQTPIRPAVTMDPCHVPPFSSSGHSEGRSVQTVPALATQVGASDQQGHAGASNQNELGLVSRSDSASSAAAHSRSQSLGPSPQGPGLLHSSSHDGQQVPLSDMHRASGQLPSSR